MLTLAQASAATGMDRSSIRRAIKRGAISGSKDHNGSWFVDAAELARVFPFTTQAAPQDAQGDALLTHKLAIAEERLAELTARLSDMQDDRDHWRGMAERLALPGPAAARRPWWPWWRAG